MDKFFLKASFQDDWTEVTKEVWIKAERNAGFRPKCSSDDPRYMTICATGGFSGSNIEGKIEFDKNI